MPDAGLLALPNGTVRIISNLEASGQKVGAALVSSQFAACQPHRPHHPLV
jgi:hypothetical protein